MITLLCTLLLKRLQLSDMGAAAALGSGLESSTNAYTYSNVDQGTYMNVLQNSAYAQSQALQNGGLLAQMKKSGYDV